jgi:hypothetical protein
MGLYVRKTKKSLISDLETNMRNYECKKEQKHIK